MVVPLSFEVLGQSGCAYAVHIADGKPVPVAWIFRIGQRPFGERKMKMDSHYQHRWNHPPVRVPKRLAGRVLVESWVLLQFSVKDCTVPQLDLWRLSKNSSINYTKCMMETRLRDERSMKWTKKIT